MNDLGLQEPRIHSNITDGLPDDHPLAFTDVCCERPACGLLHARNNECMVTWVETGVGNFCLQHFATLIKSENDVVYDKMAINHPDHLEAPADADDIAPEGGLPEPLTHWDIYVEPKPVLNSRISWDWPKKASRFPPP